MSAEVLRECAALMRKRAEAATPGPWQENVLGSEGYAVMGARPDALPTRRAWVARCGMEAWEVDKANAAHIASWHPAVALAVADWLDGAADFHEAVTSAGGQGLRADNPGALTVARAYLGGDQ